LLLALLAAKQLRKVLFQFGKDTTLGRRAAVDK